MIERLIAPFRAIPLAESCFSQWFSWENIDAGKIVLKFKVTLFVVDTADDQASSPKTIATT
jgi:hypothetical protein